MMFHLPFNTNDIHISCCTSQRVKIKQKKEGLKLTVEAIWCKHNIHETRDWFAALRNGRQQRFKEEPFHAVKCHLVSPSRLEIGSPFRGPAHWETEMKPVLVTRVAKNK